ncbi:NADH-quinone oxidoreductase subunit J [Streptomyces alkaliphilus]|uniref:NADH-quinone oxidoreductase subunit J n=1 Tax=Streptomyces alkaliphilus TaxID=1472722 RepID=UPI0034D25E2D
MSPGPGVLRTAAEGTPGFLSPSGVGIVFLLVGVVVLGAAVLCVTTTRLVRAALYLVVALGGLAVQYLLLTAEFIAWVQVLIYLGSVVVLVLFGLMLTKAPIGPSPDANSAARPVALVVAGSAAVLLVVLVVDAFRTTWIDLETPHGLTADLGTSMFRHWVLPFEALSLLLLAALIGAIAVSRRHATGPGNGPATGPGSAAVPNPRGRVGGEG